MAVRDCAPDVTAWKEWAPNGCAIALPCDLTLEDLECAVRNLLPPGEAWEGEVTRAYFDAVAGVMFELAGDALCELYKHLDPLTSDHPDLWVRRLGLYPNDCFTFPVCDEALLKPIFKAILTFFMQLRLGRVVNVCFFRDIAAAFNFDVDVFTPGLVNETLLCDFYTAPNDEPRPDTSLNPCGTIGYTYSTCAPGPDTVYVRLKANGPGYQVTNNNPNCLVLNNALCWVIGKEFVQCLMTFFAPWQTRLCFVET